MTGVRGAGLPVLVSDGGNGQNRSALAAVRALGAAGYRPTVTVSCAGSLAAASRHCAGIVRVPAVDSAQYAEAVRAELVRGGHVALLPASDAALAALGLPGVELIDKAEVSARTRRAGLPVLGERVFATDEALREAAGDLDYPVVVKPVVRTSPLQPPVRRVDSAHALRTGPVLEGALVVQPYVDGAMTAVSGVIRDGQLVAVVHQRYLRTWPARAGVACAAVSVTGDLDREQRLLQVLRGYDGIFQAQFVGPYLLDVNPRVYGSLPLAFAAGVNLPALHCDLLRGVPVPVSRGRAGVRYRWVEGDARHLAARWSAGELSLWQCVDAALPRRGTAHSTESLRDPGPALARLRHVVRSRGPHG